MSKVQIQISPKLLPVYASKYRYRGAYGGRGGGKTKPFSLMTAVTAYQLAEAGRTGIILCAREYMNSLEQSSMSEIKRSIREVPFLNNYFEIGEKYIRTKNRRITYVFAGLHDNLDSIKSKSEILICWVDEAEAVSERAWQKLIPTVRAKGSEIWITWNPEDEDSATNQRFIVNPPPNSCIVDVNWRDNPWFPEEMEAERVHDFIHNQDSYEHVWEGGYLVVTAAQIFKDKFSVRDFDVKKLTTQPYHGMDFGFSQDPTVTVQVYVENNKLYISKEAGSKRLDLDSTAQYMTSRIKDLEKYVIRADCARPESISYLKRHGLPHITAAKKWKGSVEDGVEFMKSFDEIVLHPSCVEAIKEFKHYSYKIDKNTLDPLPIIVDAWNHYIDATRYALDPLIRNHKGARVLIY